MSYQNSNIVEAIKQRFSIQDAARMIGLSLKKDGSSRYKALCPFHADRNPSLVIWPEDGKWNCFGCGKHGDAIDLVAEAKGMSNSEAIKYLAEELGIDAKPAKERKKPRGKLVAEFFYRDEGGQVRYKVSRYENGDDKTFPQSRPDGKGGWIENLDGVERLPYRLPELMESLKKGETIFIPEGEKAVHALVDLGLAATCNSGGAGKWTDALNRYFPAGAEIVILPDNDEPGRKHAEMVAANLYRRGCKVKVVKLPGIDDLSPKGAAGPENKADVVDWLAAGHTKEELLAVVSQAEYWQPKPEAEADGLAEFRKLLRVHGFSIQDGWTVKLQDTKDGYTTKKLANFVAWPVAEYTLDDGQTVKRAFKITGIMANGCRLPTITVDDDEFAGMNWITKKWGLTPMVKAGHSIKDQLREAVQILGQGRVVLSTQKLTARARAKVDRALLIAGKMTDNSA
ncbi:CHC2 zinc finger domain-containing protein [Sporolituus thermophilus]|uniref:Toprim-like n=1 Tax=Sporolituus thermophilus DSM 23256 TaxID=1123285 RepID=A0A1G7PMB1_9FIRM|nr:CHC2 zinc finger domain-containing protein [Sporolituus thermophilus]SDF87367.1 Toprim-like [Sporolituus thermophilus DSM 23256]